MAATTTETSNRTACRTDGAFTFAGESDSYLTAFANTGTCGERLIGGGTGFTLSVWVHRPQTRHQWDRLIDFGNGMREDNVLVAFGGVDRIGMEVTAREC